jgi:superfamily II DNA or RNA helicase
MARTAQASLIACLSDSFDREVKSKGYSYAASGRVRFASGSKDGAFARVLGSQWYEVELRRDEGGVVGSCTCPYCRDEYTPCKHIWAAIIKADGLGYLRGPKNEMPTWFELDDEVFDDDLDDEADDAYRDEWADDEPRQPARSDRARPVPAQPQPKPAPKPKPAPWRKQFESIRSTIAQTTETPASRTQSWPAGRELLYIVDMAGTLKSTGLVLELLCRNRKMNGDWSKPKSNRLSADELRGAPDLADREIVSILLGAREQSPYYYGYSYYDSAPQRYVVPPIMMASVMEKICRTGRCMVRTSDGTADLRPLQWDDGGPWEFCVAVQREDSAPNYRLTAFVRRGAVTLPIAAPIRSLLNGLIFFGDSVARLEHFGAAAWFRVLGSLGSISVPEKEGMEMAGELLAMPKLPKLDMPEELRFEHVLAPPKPRLKIIAPGENERGPKRLLATVSFDYDGAVIANDDPRARLVDKDRRRVIARDNAAEAAAYGELRRLGFRPSSRWSRQEAPLELKPKHLPRAVPELISLGWHVEAEGKLYRTPGELSIEVSSGIDWFELHGSVNYGDTTASLPALLAALKKGQNIIELDDGSVGMLPEEWLKKYGTLAGLGAAHGDHLRFTRSQVGLLDALLASQPEATCDELFTRARDELKRFDGIKAMDAPAGFVGQLRAYQRDGLGWMNFLRQFQFGGCLADDMGLGKTVQVLALLESRRETRGDRSVAAARPASDQRPSPSLVVVPKSLVFNWKQEAARFAPQLRVLDHTGSDRTKGVAHFDDYDIVLTTYGTLRRDAIDFKDAEFDLVILDEAQAVKNAGTESAKAVRLLRGRHRLALSGTPIENHLGELWSLFDFLNPGMLGAASVLRLGGAGARNPDPATRELLAKALRPFILRRTKDQVAKDLPPKLEQTIYCELEPVQRKLYNELRDHYRSTLLGRVDRDGINKAKIQILEALLRLRQAACHPGLIDKSRTSEACAKLDVLLPQLEEVMEEGHKVLVFSQFTSMLAILRDRLDSEKVRYEYLDGKTRDRGARVAHFQNDPDCKLFLISLKAGGLGLNLTAAEYVFLLDPWWNPAVEAQAIDRTHRIGQSRQVFAYRLIARDTVEEKVLALQDTKRNLADAIINADNSLIRNLGREDLELLLS